MCQDLLARKVKSSRRDDLGCCREPEKREQVCAPVCVCVCMYEREREGERRETDKNPKGCVRMRNEKSVRVLCGTVWHSAGVCVGTRVDKKEEWLQSVTGKVGPLAACLDRFAKYYTLTLSKRVCAYVRVQHLPSKLQPSVGLSKQLDPFWCKCVRMCVCMMSWNSDGCAPLQLSLPLSLRLLYSNLRKDAG